MKKLVAMLSVFLFTFGVAKAGELSISGNVKVSLFHQVMERGTSE